MSNTILSLQSICKQYSAGDNTVDALKNITLNFREKEFVSIVGASGSGKTTLLNIIGGLDTYTAGDLIIKGRSTKNYKDKDWDIYRNHNIGFVFQSYNLIMHQSILVNVELALTLAGISSIERKERATSVLNRVGLGKHLHKKPNQLSGGQMQRVAIARALINNPEILLADEPTGALDSQTSVQIMDLIQEIAGERLVIMVTHNPELAEEYSSRIIRFQDGNIISDSNPCYEVCAMRDISDDNILVQKNTLEKKDTLEIDASSSLAEQIKAYDRNKIIPITKDETLAENLSVPIEEEKEHKEENVAVAETTSKAEKKNKTSMSFATAFVLSAKNLLSKKTRSILTAIAGSIGIISVCLVLAFSNGFSLYMRSIQEDMLSSSPMQLSERTTDITVALKNGGLRDKLNTIKDFATGNQVGVNNLLTSLAQGAMIQNNLTPEVIEKVNTGLAPYTNAIMPTTGVEFYDNIFTTYPLRPNVGFPFDKEPIQQVNYSITELKSYFRQGISKDAPNFLAYERIINSMPCVSVMPNSDFSKSGVLNFPKSQYDLMAGEWPKTKNETILVVDAKNRASDITLTQLGFLDSAVFLNNILAGIVGGTTTTTALENRTEIVSNATRTNDGKTVNYNEIFEKEYTVFYNDAVYTQIANPSPYEYIYDGKKIDLNVTETTGQKLKISGIVRLKSGLNSGCLQEGLNLTESFVHDYLQKNATQQFSQYIQNLAKTKPSQIPTGIGLKEYSMKLDGSSSTKSKYTLPVSEVQKLVGARTEVADIYIYAKSFKDKTAIINWFADYNAGQEKANQLTYSDSVSTVMDMMNEMMNIITIVLVAFTGISLLVSTVMIGIITFVSVVERTKEIGILRSIGARKRDIRTLFNMETFIIGLIAGLFGVLVTYILQIPINLLMMSMFNIRNIANLQIWVALIMVFVSVGLTLLSGLIPASAAAKKEPVIALRS